MTVPPRLEPSCSISSASDERSIVSCERFAGVSKPPSALNDEALVGAGNGEAHLERQRELRRVGRRARLRDLGQARKLGDRARASRRSPTPRRPSATTRAARGTRRRRTVIPEYPSTSTPAPLIHQTGYRRIAAPPPSLAASRRRGSTASRSSRNGVACGTCSRRAAGNRPSDGIDHVPDRQSVADDEQRLLRSGEQRRQRRRRSAARPPPGSRRRRGTARPARSPTPTAGTPRASPPRTSRSRSRRAAARRRGATDRPASASSSVSCVRRSRELKPTSIESEARSEPSSRASSLPALGEPSAGRRRVDDRARIRLGVRVTREDQRLHRRTER